MQRRGDTEVGRAVTYCLIPRDLAPHLHELLRHHWRDDPVEVVVESRFGDRRVAGDRRGSRDGSAELERRRIRSREGRRVGERRATVLPVDAPLALPRKARAHAGRLVFVERIEPSSEHREDLDTARMVTRLQSGRTDEFAALYMRYFDRVYSYLQVALRDRDEAEDAAQQVFMQVLEALPRYERRHQPFRAWLFAVVRNHVLARMKKLQRSEPVAPQEIDRRRDAEVETSDDSQDFDWLTDRELLMFIERLPLGQRQVLTLRFLLDLSHPEIAEILDRSPNEVRVMQHRALKFLRARLQAVGRQPRQSPRSRMARCPRKAPVLRSRRFALLP